MCIRARQIKGQHSLIQGEAAENKAALQIIWFDLFVLMKFRVLFFKTKKGGLLFSMRAIKEQN